MTEEQLAEIKQAYDNMNEGDVLAIEKEPNTDIIPYKERLGIELVELMVKLDKLEEFYISNQLVAENNALKYLMKKQIETMEEYVQILRARIDL